MSPNCHLLSLSLCMSMKLMTVDIRQSGKVYSLPLPLTRHIKNWGNTIPLNCTFGRKGMFHIYLQSSKLAWNEAWLVPVISLIFLAEIKFLDGISKILNKISGKPVNFLAAYVYLGERNNHKCVMLKRADWVFWRNKGRITEHWHDSLPDMPCILCMFP